jgi:uncharacterized protein (DUF2141 family)
MPVNYYTVKIKVTNIRNNKGTMQFQVYRNQETFGKETPYKQFRISKKDVKNKTMTYEIKGLKAGVYGIALLDDENSNKKMDYSWLVPTEGFGFSDYYHTAWSKPKFYYFDFELSSHKSVTMKVRYL